MFTVSRQQNFPDSCTPYKKVATDEETFEGRLLRLML